MIDAMNDLQIIGLVMPSQCKDPTCYGQFKLTKIDFKEGLLHYRCIECGLEHTVGFIESPGYWLLYADKTDRKCLSDGGLIMCDYPDY